jgi:Ca2+/Na+ antiporter
MSEGFATPPPPAPAPRVRPPVVTAATWLLLVVAALLAISFVMAVANSGTIGDVYEEAYRGTEQEGTEGAAVAGVIGAGALNLLFAIGFVVLALLNHRGKNPARIVTWVLGGVALCCSGVGLALSGITANLQVDTADGPDPAEVQRMVEDALPDWYTPVSLGITIAVLVALAATLILLALPAANQFFRKREQPFEPPPGYPPVG